MRNRVLWLAIVTLWIVDGGLNQHAQAHITSPGRQAEIWVLDAAFGIFSPSASGEPSFVPTNIVPYVVGQDYGWFIKIKTDQPTVKWREVFTLPAAPNTWGVEGDTEDLSITNDGKTSTFEQEVVPEEGLIFNSWTIAPGDPQGKHVIRVYIEGGIVHIFEFEIRERQFIPRKNRSSGDP